ncbi:MAG: hypothetical protein D8M57_16065 [Candidatus Scalindua sp. AMX11]|nr:MAG: hypothetical protein DWQ00_03540 [Candidatus Scalindua sp.]NOG82790.1 hypothetical protein [Planctomycetota bacterium]RZV69018.1 MAG: hypothetical protein EX341_16230 [Candidatus Scalindua sp. SCAELEC01]TDE63849.1 MAG: hypothetical protein D8M57_16065 [Candidatus Scalindua sp. AMX11]GJQ60440.1 MAG: hypothetical protein SCALA701_32410 [Candidatus Scalindua sp.]
MSKPTDSDLRAAYQDLYDHLDDAYWAATTIEAKDKIRGISEVVSDLLTDMNQADLSLRTEQYLSLKKSIKGVNKNLDKLKKEIDDIIKKVKLARQILNVIDKALDTAAKFFV